VFAYRVESVQAHGARVGLAKAEQGLDERGLARAVGAEQRDELAVADVKRGIIDRPKIAEGDLETLDDDGVTHA